MLTYLRTYTSLLILLTISTLCRSGEYGGEKTGTFRINKSGGPHTVSRDIIVRPKSTLIVEAGAELRFAQGVGVKVYGELLARVRIQENQFYL